MHHSKPLWTCSLLAAALCYGQTVYAEGRLCVQQTKKDNLETGALYNPQSTPDSVQV
jgi:hypothetical protein